MSVAEKVKVFTQFEGERGKLDISRKVPESPRDSILKGESEYENSLGRGVQTKSGKMPELGRKR